MSHDRTYEAYCMTVRQVVSPEAIISDVARTQPSDKFTWQVDHWHAAPYPGFTIITPPFADDAHNHPLYVQLADIQQELVQRLGRAAIGLLPVSSLHLTLADLVSHTTYEPYRNNPARQENLQNTLAQIFAAHTASRAPRLYVAGLSAFGTAVTAVLRFASEADYAEVTGLRQAIYNGLPDVEWSASFIAHISLFYKQLTSDMHRTNLVQTLQHLNRRIDWAGLPPFTMRCVEFRYFEDMAAFTRETAWPVFTFPGIS